MVNLLRRAKQVRKRRDDLPGRLITMSDPFAAAAEDYKALRTRLFYSTMNTPHVVMFTSPGPGEGKTTTCANLGVVLAQADKSTLVVDCDLRKPTLHKIFGLRNVRGLTNVLAGEYDLQDVWVEPLQGLKVVTVGQMPFNPTEVLSSRRYTEFLRKIRQDFDYVLLNASPTQPVSDAMILASQADAVLVVFDAQRLHEGPVRRAIHALGAVEANVLGTVMTNVMPPEKGDYY